MPELEGRKVLVLGLGDTGMSMARWCNRHGAAVTVADTRAAPPRRDELEREFASIHMECGEFRQETTCAADLIAISPGVDRRTPAIAAAIGRGVPVVGDIELFAQALAQFTINSDRSRPIKIVATTGTNGKSTVTRMAGDICAAAGLTPVVAGNIGTPVLDTLSAIEDGTPAPGAFVLELSSFQLESTLTLNAHAAAMLNISDDHLDRYDGIEDYAAAKARIFAGDGVQVLNRDDARSRAMASDGRVVHRFGLDTPRGDREWGIVQNSGERWLARGRTRLMSAGELPVTGLHNAANALAAAALAYAIGVDDEIIVKALRNFRGLPHRVEKIAEVGGVVFFDDSKGTNVGATVAALEGSVQPVVLIAGGDGKGQDFGPLREAVGRHARAVVLIGRDRERLAGALAGCGVECEHAGSMEHAVRLAFALSRRGDAVLLSPACASFDMFRNYAHRGEVFAAEVRKLVDDGKR